MSILKHLTANNDCVFINVIVIFCLTDVCTMLGLFSIHSVKIIRVSRVRILVRVRVRVTYSVRVTVRATNGK